MFVPSAKSKRSLAGLFIISVILFIWVNNSRMYVAEEFYEEKLEAAKTMQLAIDTIKDYRLSQGVVIDDVNDPNKTGLIGEKETLIITDRGSLTAKLTSLNPNISATVIEMLKKAKVKKGDKVVLSCTGSFPAMNIAVMSAAKVLGLDLVMVSSVGSSMFGASDPDFNWLDMETLLVEKGVFPYKSVAASLGGGRDLGRGLNIQGRKLIEASIEKNQVTLVKEENLSANINKKMEILEAGLGKKKAKLYINVGGGLSSLGTSKFGNIIKPGYHRYLSSTNNPLKGTMFLFADKGTPVVHLLNVSEIAEKYDLPVAPDPLPEPGTGRVFEDERYNINVVTIALIILLVCIVAVIFFDHQELKLKEGEINI